MLAGCDFPVEKPVRIYAFIHDDSMEISTLSTWFSTEKGLILLKKTKLCGKLDVDIRMHNAFSTYGAVVENQGLFVENSRKNL